MDAAEFWRIMGHFATGVAVVTTRDPDTGTPCGLTVMFTCMLSPSPVLVCVEKHADSHEYRRADTAEHPSFPGVAVAEVRGRRAVEKLRASRSVRRGPAPDPEDAWAG